MELCRAPAKINLALEILGRRPDGFHEIASVIQAVGLYDELRVAPAETLRLTCDRSAPAGADNPAARAARALPDATACRRRAEPPPRLRNAALGRLKRAFQGVGATRVAGGWETGGPSRPALQRVGATSTAPVTPAS